VRSCSRRKAIARLAEVVAASALNSRWACRAACSATASAANWAAPHPRVATATAMTNQVRTRLLAARAASPS
jgi:hypothetical protein